MAYLDLSFFAFMSFITLMLAFTSFLTSGFGIALSEGNQRLLSFMKKLLTSFL